MRQLPTTLSLVSGLAFLACGEGIEGTGNHALADLGQSCDSVTNPCSSGNGNCCSGTCVDLSSDPGNCGTCGAACAATTQCSAGVCDNACSDSSTCQPGYYCNTQLAQPACVLDTTTADCASSAQCNGGFVGQGVYCDSNGKCSTGCSQNNDCATDFCFEPGILGQFFNLPTCASTGNPTDCPGESYYVFQPALGGSEDICCRLTGQSCLGNSDCCSQTCSSGACS